MDFCNDCGYRDCAKHVPLRSSCGGGALKASSSKAKADTEMIFFPEKLHALLCRSAEESSIQWLPHGRAFRVVDAILFENHVLPM